MRGRDRKLVSLLIFLAMPAAASTVSDAQAQTQTLPAWEKIRNDDGVDVYRRELPGSPVIAFRGDGIVDAPVARVLSVLADTKRAVEWMDSTAEERVIRKISPTEEVVYTHVSTPPIVMKDRDFVTLSQIVFEPATHRVIIKIRSVDDPAAPRTNYIRGVVHDSSFSLTSIDGGKRTRVVAEIHADPKGSVAKWIVNMFQKDWPHNTLASLRKQVKKRDVVEDAELTRLLVESGI